MAQTKDIEPSKPEKLTITAYKDAKRDPKTQVGTPFIAMFNPESFSKQYVAEYAKGQGMNSTGKEAKFAHNKPPVLSIKLLLDGTGCHEVTIAKSPDKGKTVAQRIKDLLDIGFRMNGKIHEPNFLTLTWGEGLNFYCRLSSVDINYTSFMPNGTTLRAELDLKFFADENDKKRNDSKESPDLTHSRLIKAGDTLPLLSKEIYGSASHYLWIAGQNKLDDFRNLTPGQRLFFPPLVL